MTGLLVATVGYALVAALIFAPLEWLASKGRRGPRWSSVDALFATVGALLTHGLVALVAGGVLAAAGEVALDPLPTWAALPIGLVLFELAGYACHRAAHAHPALWAFHAVHHSSTTMSWWAGFRQHPVEALVMTVAQNLPLVLLGLPLTGHVALVVGLRLHATLVHADLRLPRAIAVFVTTPGFHHRHHALDEPTANFATLFPWIDRLFGTFAPQVSTAAGRSYGLVEAPAHGFAGWLLHPFVALAAPSGLHAPGPPRGEQAPELGLEVVP